MSSILETFMLVCFGFSWPINVIKAYKAKTAKGSSVAFILLIITGYVAGISAKIVNGKMNYVLIVYIIKLVIVFTNLIIYFRNRSLDAAKRSFSMNKKSDNAVVLFGGTFDKEIPVAEIAQDYELNFKMYNKSSYSLNLKNAKKVYMEQMQNKNQILNPESVIIHIGSEDLEMFNKNSADFDVAYLDLINFIKFQNPKSRIALVSNSSLQNKKVFEEMNRHIKAIASSENCVFVNLENIGTWEPENTKQLMSFMYNVGFDQPLNVKKPLLDIAEIIYSYAYQNGILHQVERQSV